MRQALSVSGVGDVTQGKIAGDAAASKEEQQVENEYKEVHLLQRRAEAALEIMLEQDAK